MGGRHWPKPSMPAVIYERTSSNPFWIRRRNPLAAQLHFTSLNFSQDRLQSFFLQASLQERSKEEKLLDKFLPKNQNFSNYTLTDKINILLQNQKHYTDTLERIRRAIKQNYKSGAPNMSTFFTSYLETSLKTEMELFRQEVGPNLSGAQMESKFKSHLHSAMLNASERMANARNLNETPNQLGGGAEDWAAIDQALRQVPGMWGLFETNLFQKIGIKNFDQLRDNIYENQKYNTKNFVNNLLLHERMQSLGGTVAENAMAALAASINGLSGGSGDITWTMSGGALTSEVGVTDTVHFFSANADISAQSLFNKINNMREGETFQSKIDDAIGSLRSDLDNLFGIFVNAKNYSLGTNAHSITKTVRGSLEQLPGFLSSAGIQVSNVQDFLNTAYNTGAGAYFASGRGTIETDIINALKAAAAKIMFDDYSTIGSSDVNAIHLYQLDNIYIPSSEIFGALADAAQASSVTTKATVTLPSSINDLGPKWPGRNNSEIKNFILDWWQVEIEEARAESEYTATFTMNLRKALGERGILHTSF